MVISALNMFGAYGPVNAAGGATVHVASKQVCRTVTCAPVPGGAGTTGNAVPVEIAAGAPFVLVLNPKYPEYPVPLLELNFETAYVTGAEADGLLRKVITLCAPPPAAPQPRNTVRAHPVATVA